MQLKLQCFFCCIDNLRGNHSQRLKMVRVTKIVIKRSPNFFEEPQFNCNKVTITESSIAYEYVSVIEKTRIDYQEESQFETLEKKWSYKTNSPIFKSIYDEIVQMVPDIVERNPAFCTDIGGMKFIITYSDNSKIERIFFTNRDYFKDWFAIIKKLVPTTEQIPDVLLTSDDYKR